jgi:hypothetical protein
MRKWLTGNEVSPDKIDVSTVQKIAGLLAQIVDSTSEILTICHSGLPRSPQLPQMIEGSIPADLSAAILGDIEVLVNDTLADASKILRGMESGERVVGRAEGKFGTAPG